MKKSLLICMFSVLVTGTLVTSCSDDNNGNEPTHVVCPVDPTVFTDANGLVLTYSGQPMIGKQVQFTPSTTEEGRATLVLSGVSSLPENLQSKADLPGSSLPGVIPGETSTTIEIIYQTDGDKITFSGEDENTAGRIIKYQGEALNGSMQLNLEVTMPQNSLAGTSWKLQEYNLLEGKQPIHYVWKSDSELTIMPGFSLTMEKLFYMALNSTLIGGQLTPQDALAGVLNKVTFNADGNIVAEYKDELTDPEWKISPLNLALYTVPANGSLSLYLNISQIMANIEQIPASKAAQEETMGNILNMLLPILGNGIVLTTSTENEVMKVYLGSEFIVPLLKAMAPMFEDETFLAYIVEMIKPGLEDMGISDADALILSVLKQVSVIFNSTTEVELGINLIKA